MTVEVITPVWEVTASSPPSTIEVVSGIAPGRPYSGGYEVAPTSERQVLHTALCTLTEDLVIDPIPDNYGLIEWDGSVLTVR